MGLGRQFWGQSGSKFDFVEESAKIIWVCKIDSGMKNEKMIFGETWKKMEVEHGVGSG
jgi:hypothetical protein